MTVERFNAVVGADIRTFKRKMREVDREIRDLATGVDVDLDLATEEFYAEMKAVKKEIKGLDNKNLRIEVELAYMEFKRKMAEIYAVAETLDDSVIDYEIDLEIDKFRRKLAKAKMLALGMDDVDIDVDLNTSQFYRKYFKVAASIAALQAKDVVVKLKLDYRNFQQTMGRVASSMRNWGEIFSTMLTGSIISMIPMLSPLIASLVGLIGSLGVMIGVLAGQFLILTAGVSAAALAFGSLAAVAIPTIQKLFDETAKLNAEQQRARDSWDGLVDAYNKIVEKTEGAVLEAFTYSMYAAKAILEALEPMILATADAAARLAQAFNRSINTEPIQRIFDAFNEYGAGIFENVVRAIGNFVAGIGSLIAALTPAANEWSKNFNEMSKGFAEWAAGLSQSEKFQSFIDYVQTYMPVISKIFGDMVLGIVDFFAAFSELGGDFMVSLSDMMERFREWSSTLGENETFKRFIEYIRESTPEVLRLLGNLIDFLINVGISMAPFGAMIMDLTNWFLELMNSLMENHKWFRNIVGFIPVLIGGFMTLMAPLIMLWTIFGTRLVTAITALMKIFKNLGGALSRLLPYITPIIDDALRLIGTFTRLGSTLGGLALRALPMLGQALGLLAGPVGLAIGIIATLIAIGIKLYKNWDEVSRFAKEIWGKIADFFSTTVSGIYDTVVGWFSKMWDGITGWLGDIYSSISGTWGEIVSFLGGINLWQIGSDIIQGLVNGIDSAMGWVKQKVEGLGTLIPGWLKKVLGIKSPSRVMAALAKFIPQGVAKGITDNMNVVKSAVNMLSGAVTVDFSKQIDKMSYGYRQMIAISSRAYSAAAKEGIIERYEAFEQALNDYKRFAKVTLEEEREYWLAAARLTEDNTDVKSTMLRKAAELHEQAMQEQYENEVYYLDKATKYQAMSVRQQIAVMEQYMQQYAAGTAQQIAYEEKLYDVKTSLYDSLLSVAEKYQKDMQSVYDRMIDDEKRLRDEWQNTFKSRRQTLADTWGLFDKVNLTEMITFDSDGNIKDRVDIIQNMREQVNTMSKWMHDLFRLESFGLDEALIDELRAMGPKAAAEINALANMSASELNEYQKLWRTKMDLAGMQATHELEKARLEMEREVEKLHLNTAKELDKMKVDMLKEMDEIVNGSTDKFNILQMTLPEIGKKAMEGLIDSFNSMEGALKSTISRIAQSAATQMNNIMNGVQLNVGLLENSLKSNFSLNNAALANADIDQPPIYVDVYNEWDGEQVRTYVEEKNAANRKLQVKKG